MSNFSCYVTIVNQTTKTMSLTSLPDPAHGSYVTDPASSISGNGGSMSFEISQDNFLSPGPVGTCTYAVQDAGSGSGSITFSYSCPVTDPNATDAVLSGNATVKIQMIPNPLPEYGNPVNVQFTIFDN